MARYQAIIAYDGTDLHGFQLQSGVRTVQGELEAALQHLAGNPVRVAGAGRTDAGVHAAGQVIAFDLDWRHSLDDLRNALNANLPRDVAVRALNPARDGFHPRFDAKARSYAYHLAFSPARDPLSDRYAWVVWPAPDIALMQQAALHLAGTHDFASFGTAPDPGGHTVREVLRAGVAPGEAGAVFTIEANAFLFRMVRRIVGTLVRVGTGRLTVAAFAALIDQPDSRANTPAAPPQGLRFLAVRY